MINKNKIFTSIFAILIFTNTAQAWRVDKAGVTQMKLTDTGRLWIGADGNYGEPKMAVTTTETSEDRALDVTTLRTTGNNYGLVSTAAGNGANMNIGLYGWASDATVNYGLYVARGLGYFYDKVGIGTTSPSANLEIKNENTSLTLRNSGNAGTYSYLRFLEGGTSENENGLAFKYDSENNKMWIIDNNGEGIVASFRRSGTELFRVNGEMGATGYNNYSDKRLKKDIKDLNNSLQKVLQLRGVTYRWKDTNKSQTTQIGFIAQEVEKIVPAVVSKPKTNDEFYSMDYGKLTALLVEAVKELKQQNDNLKELVCQDHPDAQICEDTSK